MSDSVPSFEGLAIRVEVCHLIRRAILDDLVLSPHSNGYPHLRKTLCTQKVRYSEKARCHGLTYYDYHESLPDLEDVVMHVCRGSE